MSTPTQTIDMATITHVIMDIEGTVAPIEFVHQKMFPYVRDNVQTYLDKTWETEQTQADIKLLIDQSTTDKTEGFDNISLIDAGSLDKATLLPQLVANVTSQMDIDRKIGALKTLQGHIWAEAFGSGALVAELYPDVYDALELWSQKDGKDQKTLCIYSSGSIGAQKLLFSHTAKGDLTPIFKGFYDTGVGFKREMGSYVNILKDLGMESSPQKCLFLTDIYEESVAADLAGMKTVIILRPGNYPLPDGADKFQWSKSFMELGQ